MCHARCVDAATLLPGWLF